MDEPEQHTCIVPKLIALAAVLLILAFGAAVLLTLL